METRNTEVLIVGAGPVGLVLAHQLGIAGVNTLQIEAAAALSDEPRAVALDPESLRSFQSMGLLDELRPDILFGVIGDYLNGRGELLFAIDNEEPGPFGYPGLSSFSQPALVRTLAAELQRYPHVELVFEHTLLDFEQDETGVSARVREPTGVEVEVRAQYLVACDGGRSGVRARLGIEMRGESNAQPWLVIDTREKEPDGKKNFRFFCDPERPGMFLQTPHNNRRWEWMVLPGEDRDAFLEDEVIHRLISPHVDVEKIDIFRRRVYDFHAILADRFQQGRVFLAGDAAHMTPPFAGQGLNSGIRDAVNLGWKLGCVLSSNAPLALLDSYEQERWTHAKELIEVALALGAQIQPTDTEMAAARDAHFADLHSQPKAAMDGFVGGLFKAMADRYFDNGAAIDIAEDSASGRMLPQPSVIGPEGSSQLLDNYLGSGFALVGLGCDPALVLDEKSLAPWRERGAQTLALDCGELSLGAHGDLFRQSFSRGGYKMALVRPDRFCMAVFNVEDAADKLARAVRIIGEGRV